MANIDLFAALMIDTIVVNSFSSIDSYGKPSYSTSASTYAARVVDSQELVRAIDGTQKVARTKAWVNCTGTISPKDKITLPNNTNPPVLSVDRFPDRDGIHHIRIFFG